MNIFSINVITVVSVNGLLDSNIVIISLKCAVLSASDLTELRKEHEIITNGVTTHSGAKSIKLNSGLLDVGTL